MARLTDVDPASLLAAYPRMRKATVSAISAIAGHAYDLGWAVCWRQGRQGVEERLDFDVYDCTGTLQVHIVWAGGVTVSEKRFERGLRPWSLPRISEWMRHCLASSGACVCWDRAAW